jgi:hypothetical protein
VLSNCGPRGIFRSTCPGPARAALQRASLFTVRSAAIYNSKVTNNQCNNSAFINIKTNATMGNEIAIQRIPVHKKNKIAIKSKIK